MIKSTKQYTTTKKRMEEFEHAILEFNVDAPPEGVSPLGHKAALAALQGMRDELAAQLLAFEGLERRGIEAVRFERLADLPRALIETRIARGMTQKDIADQMEVPSQQVQRWEANDYDRTGLAYVIEVGEILNIDEVLRRPRAVSKVVNVTSDHLRPSGVAKPARMVTGDQMITGIDQQQMAAGWSVWGGSMTAAEILTPGVLQSTSIFRGVLQEGASQSVSRMPARRKEQEILFQAQQPPGLDFVGSAVT